MILGLMQSTERAMDLRAQEGYQLMLDWKDTQDQTLVRVGVS